MVEKTVSSEIIFEGKRLSVRCDTVELSNGQQSYRELVSHPPAVVILAADDQQHVYLVKQYRKAIDEVLIEFPAGCVEVDEELLVAAKREFKEECGCEAKKWTYLNSFFPTPGFCNEEFHFFLAEQLIFGEQSLDFDEELSCFSWSFSTFKSAIETNKIKDLKTVLGFYLLQNFFGEI